MLKAHIVMRRDTDIVAELDRLADRAREHRLEPFYEQAMLNAVEAVMADLKSQAAETATHGISLNVTKHVSAPEYDITIELQSAGSEVTKLGFLSKIFGR